MRIALGLLICALAAPAFARDTYVKPHVRKDGTYVEGHYRSAPDNNRFNNYSTQGNTNPYTGQRGYTDPFQAPQPSFGQPPRPYNPYGQ
jgi:hypothetical protein